MNILKRFKENILDDVPYVIYWRAYTTLSALMLWMFVMNANTYFDWSLSDQTLIIVDWALLFLPMSVSVAIVIYYIVLLVLAICKKTRLPNPDAEGLTSITPYRWFAYMVFSVFLALAARVVQVGVEEISINPKVFHFAIIFYASILVVMEIEFVAKLFRSKLSRGYIR